MLNRTKPFNWADYKYISFPGQCDYLGIYDPVVIEGINSAEDRIKVEVSHEIADQIWESLKGKYYGYWRKSWVGCYFFYRADAVRPAWLNDAQALMDYVEMKEFNQNVRWQPSGKFHLGDGKTFIID